MNSNGVAHLEIRRYDTYEANKGRLRQLDDCIGSIGRMGLEWEIHPLPEEVAKKTAETMFCPSFQVFIHCQYAYHFEVVDMDLFFHRRISSDDSNIEKSSQRTSEDSGHAVSKVQEERSMFLTSVQIILILQICAQYSDMGFNQAPNDRGCQVDRISLNNSRKRIEDTFCRRPHRAAADAAGLPVLAHLQSSCFLSFYSEHLWRVKGFSITKNLLMSM